MPGAGSFPDVPTNTDVSCLTASPLDTNTVFAAFDNHKNGDYKPYIFRSADRGKTWTAPEPTSLKSPCSPASIKRLPGSSDLLAIYNDHSGDFPFPKNKRTVEIWPARTDIDITDYLGVYGVPDGTAPSDLISRITLREGEKGTEQTIEFGGIQPTLADIFGQQIIGYSKREPALDKVKPQPEQYAVDYGAADAILADLPQKPFGYGAGFKASVVVLVTNTGPMTANFNSLGVANIKMPDGSDPVAGAVPAGSIIELRYDGTNLVMTGVPGGGALAAPHHTAHEPGGTDQMVSADLNYLQFSGSATAPSNPTANHGQLDLRIAGAVFTLYLVNEDGAEVIGARWKT